MWQGSEWKIEVVYIHKLEFWGIKITELDKKRIDAYRKRIDVHRKRIDVYTHSDKVKLPYTPIIFHFQHTIVKLAHCTQSYLHKLKIHGHLRYYKLKLTDHKLVFTCFPGDPGLPSLPRSP